MDAGHHRPRLRTGNKPVIYSVKGAVHSCVLEALKGQYVPVFEKE